jgi:hypothetical protein
MSKTILPSIKNKKEEDHFLSSDKSLKVCQNMRQLLIKKVINLEKRFLRIKIKNQVVASRIKVIILFKEEKLKKRVKNN